MLSFLFYAIDDKKQSVRVLGDRVLLCKSWAGHSGFSVGLGRTLEKGPARGNEEAYLYYRYETPY